VADTPVDKVVDVVIFRKGGEQTLKATVGRLEDGEKEMAQKSEDEPVVEAKPEVVDKVFGMTLKELSPEERETASIGAEVKGVLVADVEQGSISADKGIEPGEIIVEVGQEAVSTPKDVSERVAALRKEGRKNALLMVSTKAGDIRFVVLRIE
jgi:serine protease Do